MILTMLPFLQNYVELYALCQILQLVHRSTWHSMFSIPGDAKST
jgi:hypothetical protein